MSAGRYCNGTNARGHGCSVWLTGPRTNCGQHVNGQQPPSFPSAFGVSEARAVAVMDPIDAPVRDTATIEDLSTYVPRPDGALAPPDPGDAEHGKQRMESWFARKYLDRYLGRETPQGWAIEGPTYIQTHDSYRHSGHKLHIACESAEDVTRVVDALYDTAGSYGFGMKAASKHLIEPPEQFELAAHRHMFDGSFKKGVTVILPRRDTLDRDTAAVLDALGDYECEAPIAGDSHVAGPVWHRFELSHDPGYDVTDYREYRDLYERA